MDVASLSVPGNRNYRNFSFLRQHSFFSPAFLFKTAEFVLRTLHIQRLHCIMPIVLAKALKENHLN